MIIYIKTLTFSSANVYIIGGKTYIWLILNAESDQMNYSINFVVIKNGQMDHFSIILWTIA